MTDTSKTEPTQPNVTPAKPPAEPNGAAPTQSKDVAKEYGGPKGLEPTRYGDWEKGGRCIDF